MINRELLHSPLAMTHHLDALLHVDDSAMQTILAAYPQSSIIMVQMLKQLCEGTSDSTPYEPWAFVTSPDGKVGFWYPTGHSRYKVSVESNHFQNDAMQNVALGAGLTTVALNWHMWHEEEVYERGSPEALPEAERKALNDKYYALQSFIYELSEAGLVEAESFAGFID